MTPEKAIDSTLAAKVDELGSLKREYETLIAPFKLKAPRMEALEKELREGCPAPAEEAWTAEGVYFQVVLGPRAMQRTINVSKLFKLVGGKILARMCTVTLKALTENCEPEIVEQVTALANTGSRRLSIVQKGD